MIYIFLKYLWIIMLLPKVLQLLAYGMVFVLMLWEKKGNIRLSNYNKCFLAYGFIHLLSILYNCGIRTCEFSRIFAAVNTASIWILAIMIAALISNEKIDVLKAGRYCLINSLILIVLYFVSEIFGIDGVNYGIASRSLVSLDWLNGMQTVRFTGLMEYSVLVALLGLLMIPLSVTYLVNTRVKWMTIPYLFLIFYVIKKSNSRMGMLLAIIMILLSLLYFMWHMKHLSKKTKLAIYVSIGIFGVIGAIVVSPMLVDVLRKLLFMRGDSNSMRFFIYSESIKATVSDSIFWGKGIKDMLGEYPLGSHCTYIGFFYKTGIIGSFLVIMGFIMMFLEYKRKYFATKSVQILYYAFSQVLLMMFFVTEDVDGANWLVVTFFLVNTIYSSVKDENIKKWRSINDYN